METTIDNNALYLSDPDALPDTRLIDTEQNVDDSPDDMKYAYSDSDFSSDNNNQYRNGSFQRESIQKSKFSPLPDGRLYNSELVISRWVSIHLSSKIIFPESIVKYISLYSCFNLSVRITRPVSLRTEGWEWRSIHILQLRQIQVFEKCIDLATNKPCEILCELKPFKWSKSITYIDVVVDDNISCTDDRSYNECKENMISHSDHFMEFDIKTTYAGNAFDISKIMVFNRNDKVQRLHGCKIELIYDHNIVAKQYTIKQFNTEIVWKLNPLSVDTPLVWDLLICGWLAMYIKRQINIELIALLISFYSSPICPDDTYSIQARSMFDKTYRKCFNYINTQNMNLCQDSDLYGRSHSRFIPVDAKKQYYYIQVVYWSDHYRKYLGIREVPGYKQLTYVNQMKDAAVFKLVMIHSNDEFIHYRLRYDEITDGCTNKYWVGVDDTLINNVLYPIKKYEYKLRKHFLLDDSSTANDMLEYDYISIEIFNRNFKNYLSCKGNTGFCYGSDDTHRCQFQLVEVSGNDNDLYYIRYLHTDNEIYWLGIENNKQIHARLLKVCNNKNERAIFQFTRMRHNLFYIFVYDNFERGWLHSGTLLDFSLKDSEFDASLYRILLSPNSYIFTYCIVPATYHTQEALPNSRDTFAIYSWSANRYIDYKLNNKYICETVLRRTGSRFKLIQVKASNDDIYYYIQNKYPDSMHDGWLGFELNVDVYLNEYNDYKKYRVKLYRNESKRARWRFIKCKDDMYKNNEQNHELMFYMLAESSLGKGWLNCDFDRWNNWSYLYENKESAGLYSLRLHSKRPSFSHLTS